MLKIILIPLPGNKYLALYKEKKKSFPISSHLSSGLCLRGKEGGGGGGTGEGEQVCFPQVPQLPASTSALRCSHSLETPQEGPAPSLCEQSQSHDISTGASGSCSYRDSDISQVHQKANTVTHSSFQKQYAIFSAQPKSERGRGWGED